jgi:pimeloyl-ACP methyl ester carboxylesterase
MAFLLELSGVDLSKTRLKSNADSIGRIIDLSDGRQLGYLMVGEGKPVVYFHGTASSRLEVLLLQKLAYGSKLQIIGIDRPGYGLSSFTPRKNFGAFAIDVNFLVDHLGIKEFGVLGWSGGSVFALTYAALFPKRVNRIVVVGSPALPFDISTAHNMPLARFVMKIPYIGMLAMKRMSSQVLKANANISAFLDSRGGKKMLKGLSKADEKFFSDSAWATLMYASMAEAFRQGNNGVKAIIQEHQLFMNPWEVPLSTVPSNKLIIWQGDEDKTCRVENAYRITQAIPNARLEVFKGKGHCVMFDNFEKLGDLFSLK